MNTYEDFLLPYINLIPALKKSKTTLQCNPKPSLLCSSVFLPMSVCLSLSVRLSLSPSPPPLSLSLSLSLSFHTSLHALIHSYSLTLSFYPPPPLSLSLFGFRGHVVINVRHAVLEVFKVARATDNTRMICDYFDILAEH